jgi:hypothetical protein
MTTVKIDISDQQAAALSAKAAAQGLTLERWLQKIVEKEAPVERRRYSLEDLVTQCDPDARLSDEDRAWLDVPAVGREAL